MGNKTVVVYVQEVQLVHARMFTSEKAKENHVIAKYPETVRATQHIASWDESPQLSREGWVSENWSMKMERVACPRGDNVVLVDWRKLKGLGEGNNRGRGRSEHLNVLTVNNLLLRLYLGNARCGE